MSNETEKIKQQMIGMAVTDMEKLFEIIGELGFIGYKISMCKIKGYSYKQCALKYGVSKSAAQRFWQKCIDKRYDIALKNLFQIK